MDNYFDKYVRYILKAVPFEVPGITGDRVYEAFSKTSMSAGAMYGWSPEELALLSKGVCYHIADMLNFIEDGSPWPRSSPHARAVFLQMVPKLGKSPATGPSPSRRPYTGHGRQ